MLKRGHLNNLLYTFNGYYLLNHHNRHETSKTVSGCTLCTAGFSVFCISMHFLPGISLLTLNHFVVEVKWLFPVSRQRKRESGKQRNTGPWR